jgi:hypothetical protein
MAKTLGWRADAVPEKQMRLKPHERLKIRELGKMHDSHLFVPGRGSPGSYDEEIATLRY